MACDEGCGLQNLSPQASPESASAPSPCSTGPSKGTSWVIRCSHGYPFITHQFTGKSNITLSLRFLKLFKWRDESGVKQQLRIIELISSKWQDLATLVGLSMSQMDGIEKQSLLDTEKCCLRVFDHWIISNGEFTDYPITWSGLHELLEDTGHRALAEQLKTALQTVGIKIVEV